MKINNKLHYKNKKYIYSITIQKQETKQAYYGGYVIYKTLFVEYYETKHDAYNRQNEIHTILPNLNTPLYKILNDKKYYKILLNKQIPIAVITKKILTD